MKDHEQPTEMVIDDDCSEPEDGTAQCSTDAEEPNCAPDEIIAKTPWTERAKTFLTEHRSEIIRSASFLGLLTTVICQRFQLGKQSDQIALKDARIGSLESQIRQLASDGLRHGSPLAAKCMVNRRESLRSQ